MQRRKPDERSARPPRPGRSAVVGLHAARESHGTDLIALIVTMHE